LRISLPTIIVEIRLGFRREFSKECGISAARRGNRQEKKCTPSQLALAWLLAQGQDIVPIPGTKRRKYLEENVGALNVKLSPEDLLGLTR